MKTFALIVALLSIGLVSRAAQTPIKDLKVQNSLDMSAGRITNVVDILDTNGVSLLGGTGGNGSGNVTGPVSSQVNNVAAFANTSGQLLKDTGIPYATIIVQTALNTASNQLVTAQNTSSNLVYLQNLTNGPIQKLSTGSGNEYTDMRASTNALASALGVSFTSPTLNYDLWAASGSGRGSNVWGVPINLPGGSAYIGNPYWQDMPHNHFDDQSFYWGMGPIASSRKMAWPNGNGITNGQGSVQPGLGIIQGNPYAGIAYFNARQAFTNSAHGSLAGSDSNGVPIYIPQFGYVGGQIGDAYGNPDPITGIVDQIGKYSQEAPSYQGLISSDYQLNYYISLNAHRTGDPSYGGQAPLFAIETDHFLDGGTNRVIAGFPVQAGGVWDVRQATANAPTNWQWALAVDESTGGPVVSTTNSLFQSGKIEAESTNKGSYVFGRMWDAPTAQTEFQGTVNFDLPNQVYANYGAWTFDAIGTHRFGVVITGGNYPHLGHASGTPFTISQYSASDLSTIDAGHVPGITNEFTINADSTVTIPHLNPGAAVMALGVTANGTLTTNSVPGASTNSGLGTVTSVALTAPGEFSVAGSPVTGAGTLAITRTADANFLGFGATNIGFLKITNNVSIAGPATISTLVLTNGFTNQALTASTLLEADANKKVTSIANGAGALTNDAIGNFGYAPLLNASAMVASQYAATDASTNLISTQNGNAWTNLDTHFTNYGTTTNIVLPADGNNWRVLATNGPHNFFTFGGNNMGDISVWVTTNGDAQWPAQVQMLGYSNHLTTNCIIDFQPFGGTNKVLGGESEL